MPQDDIYLGVLEYMCQNYDYSLYAGDFNGRAISALQRSIASIPSLAGKSRLSLIKLALSDFFNAVYQRVFIYEDEERLKIVKYFDSGANNEDQDRQIHALRQELLSFKETIENSFESNLLWMFDSSAKKRFELSLLHIQELPLKEIIREQISLVYELEKKDIVVFVDNKIFIKKFIHQEETKVELKKIVEDVRFTSSFWEELREKLYTSFEGVYPFYTEEKKNFFKSYPYKFSQIIGSVALHSFSKFESDDLATYISIAYEKFLPKILLECAVFLLHKVGEGELKAINFLKAYSEGVKTTDTKIKIKRQPLMDKEGNIFNFQSITMTLKKMDVLQSKITHKKLEIKKLQEKLKHSYNIAHRSEDEMNELLKRKKELLTAIEKVELEIVNLKLEFKSRNIEVDKLEFAKRDLLEAFKQVEVRIKTQSNISKNAELELGRWQDKRVQADLAKEKLDSEYRIVLEEYLKICEALSFAFSKEPLDL